MSEIASFSDNRPFCIFRRKKLELDKIRAFRFGIQIIFVMFYQYPKNKGIFVYFNISGRLTF